MDTTAFAPTTTFAGTRLAKVQRAPTCKTNTVSMSISRRAALSGAAAALLGRVGAALAKSGDSPKISVFGVGGASSPYTAGIQTGGTVQYKAYNDAELLVFKKNIDESKARLESAIEPIKGRAWSDVQSRIRLEMSDVRNTMLKLNAAIDDESTAKKATQIYTDFKLALEALDYATIVKDQAKAVKNYNVVLEKFNSWVNLVGLN